MRNQRAKVIEKRKMEQRLKNTPWIKFKTPKGKKVKIEPIEFQEPHANTETPMKKLRKKKLRNLEKKIEITPKGQ
jgi:hypothetical protein